MKLIAFVLCLFCFAVFADPPKVVYRAVLEAPADVKATGGFLPRGADGTRPNQPPPNISLFSHTNGAATGLARHDSGYVATTVSRGVAINWVSDHLNGRGWIYHIQPTGNFIDVNGTLRNFSPHPFELEYASLGMIRWNQITGWQEVRYGQVGEFVRNRDFNSRLYSQSHVGGIEPQLAGFPPGHEAWEIEPWRNFAHCSSSSLIRRSSDSIKCQPDQKAQDFGINYFYRVNPDLFIDSLSDVFL